MKRDESKDVKLVDIRDSLATRQAKVKTLAVNLNKFEVLSYDKFRVEGKDFYVENLGKEGEVRLDTLPVKQLCSAIGMNLGFYMDNPENLNTTIFNERLRLLEDDDAIRNLRFMETDKGNRLLAILPMIHQAPNYADVLDPLVQALPSNHIIRLSNASSVDEMHRLTMRISLMDYPVVVDEGDRQTDAAELGMFLDMSEDGRGGKMSLTSFVYNQVCTNGAMVSYDAHPYFSYNYRGIRAVDLGQAIKSAIGRFEGDLSEISKRLNDSAGQSMTKNHALGFLKNLEQRRDLSLGFVRKVRKDMESKEFEKINRYRLLNVITEAAQKLPYDGRVATETVAGSLLGLNLQNVA
jgi:hypothetical protein